MGNFGDGSYVLAKALEKPQELMNPHCQFDLVFYTQEEKLAECHIASGRGRPMVHYTKLV